MRLFCGNLKCNDNKNGVCDKLLVRKRLRSCIRYRRPKKDEEIND